MPVYTLGNVLPRVSFVTCLRDYGYGGSLLRRMEIFLNGIAVLAHRHGLDTEVILVVWNPSPGEPPLHEVLRVRESLNRMSVRIIVVPAELHRMLPNADRIPFFEPIGKNVGLRRAGGDYWLATNPDLLFSGAVFRVLAGGLEPGTLYRMDRHDVGKDVPHTLPVGRQLAFCARHVAGVHAGCASITFPEMVKVGRFRRRPGLQRRVEQECRDQRKGPDPLPYTEQALWPRDGIHTNASGSFLLMHRRHWEAMRGHPEFHTRGHADSVTTWAAVTHGLTQRVLRPPCFLFHQPHGRSEQRDWPQTDWKVWYQRFRKSMLAKEPLVINGRAWGFPEERFEEWLLQAAAGGQPRWERT